MKILHLISSAGMYGAEAVILTLLHEMRRAQTPCALGVFLNQASPNVALHQAACEAGFESHLLPCKGQIDSTTVSSIRQLSSDTGADIVHTHGYKADVYGYIAMRRSGLRLVATCHNWCDTDYATRLYGALDRFCLRHFAAVAAVSADVRQRLLSSGLEPNKVSVIHNGIACEPFLMTGHAAVQNTAQPYARSPLTVGFAGRLSSEKGIDLFLQAAEGVLEIVPHVRFVIAGDGAERPAIEHVIREKGLEQDVVLLGRCDDMPGFYASLDVLLSSSRTEGLPMGLMEAMVSCVAVVATAVGDVPALVKNDVTGLLVSPLDAPAMRDAVVTLLRDSDRRRRLGEAASEWIQQNFSASRMANSYIDFYDQVLNETTLKDGSRVQ